MSGSADVSAAVPVNPRKPSPAARLMLGGIWVYQYLTQMRPTPCRYLPTCSHFGAEAIEVHGAMYGGWLTIRRLGRCTPWARTNGWDPVPPLRTKDD